MRPIHKSLRLAGATFLLANLVSAASGQLFVGVDDETASARIGDVSAFPTVTWSDAFSGIQVWGAAYDSDGQQLWLSDGVGMYRSPVSGPPTYVADFNDGAASLSMVGLGWAHGALYGFRSVGATGIYRINPGTGLATLVLPTSGYDFGGLDFNPRDGLFYATNDSTSTTPSRGLYSIDVLGAGTITKIANYPAGQTDIDGLAVGGGKAWLVTDEPGNFYSYDLSQGSLGSYVAFANPWTTTHTFSGAAYIPEPASILLLAAGLLAARRRRR